MLDTVLLPANELPPEASQALQDIDASLDQAMQKTSVRLEMVFTYAQFKEARGELQDSLRLLQRAKTMVHTREDATIVAQRLVPLEAEVLADAEYATSLDQEEEVEKEDGKKAEDLSEEEFISFMQSLAAAVLAATTEAASRCVDTKGLLFTLDEKLAFQEELFRACDKTEKMLLGNAGISSAAMQRMLRRYEESAELQAILRKMQIDSHYILQTYGINL